MSQGNSPNPYRHSSGSKPAAQPPSDNAKAPGIALIVIGAISMVLMLGYFGLTVVGIMMQPELATPPPGMDPAERSGYVVGFYGGLIFPVLNAIAQVAVILGGVAMLRGKSLGMARTGAIISLIPCFSSLCFFGIPIGIWALIVLKDPRVIANFR